MENETVTSEKRKEFVLYIVLGVVLCVTPVWPVGVAMIAVGLFLLPVTYVVEPIEVKALGAAEERGGGGCWIVLIAVILVIVLFVGIVGSGLALGVV